MPLRALPAAALALCACGSSPGPSIIQVTPAMYQSTMALLTVNDGDRVDLTRPPQGGFVLFVGARVAHLNEQVVELRGRLRDAKSGALVSEDARTVTMMPTADDPTVFAPDLRSFATVANVPICPSLGSVDLFDQPYTLEVVVTELISMHVGSTTRTVIPSCRQTDPMERMLCQCQCAKRNPYSVRSACEYISCAFVCHSTAF